MILAEYTIRVIADADADADALLDLLEEADPDVSLEAVAARLRERLPADVKVEVDS